MTAIGGGRAVLQAGQAQPVEDQWRTSGGPVEGGSQWMNALDSLFSGTMILRHVPQSSQGPFGGIKPRLPVMLTLSLVGPVGFSSSPSHSPTPTLLPSEITFQINHFHIWDHLPNKPFPQVLALKPTLAEHEIEFTHTNLSSTHNPIK
jgi:hypothetical protein